MKFICAWLTRPAGSSSPRLSPQRRQQLDDVAMSIRAPAVAARARSPTAEEERTAAAAWEEQALSRIGTKVASILDGSFHLIALNALKLKQDLKIVVQRDDPLFEVIQRIFAKHCMQTDVSKSAFLSAARTVAMRCEFNIEGLVAAATDVWNEAQRAKEASPTQPSSANGKKRSFGESAAGCALNPKPMPVLLSRATITAASPAVCACSHHPTHPLPRPCRAWHRSYDSTMTAFEIEEAAAEMRSKMAFTES